MRTIVYPGTFDPITYGHMDLVARAARMFDHVMLAVATSPSKQPALPLDTRIEIARLALGHHGNVSVVGFDGLLTEFLEAHKARLILRGLRGVSDFEYELHMANVNRMQSPDIDTLFLTPDRQHASTSSTIVREIARLHGDVSNFVPPVVEQALRTRYS